MNVLDLFSGIGGFSLGLHRAGMTTVAFCEIEKYPQAVLRKNFPGVPIYDDVRTVTADRLRADGINRVNVITGGFPCQDLAICGPRKGLDGKRSGLYSEQFRIIDEFRPDYAIMENSPELITGGNGAWFARFLSDLAEIGFDAEWDVLPALAFGASHRRDRAYIVAYPSKTGRTQFVFTEIARQAKQREYHFGSLQNGFFWPEDEPPVLRAGYDVPKRVDRIRGCGNSVVPQIPEIIGRAIMQIEGLPHGL